MGLVCVSVVKTVCVSMSSCCSLELYDQHNEDFIVTKSMWVSCTNSIHKYHLSLHAPPPPPLPIHWRVQGVVMSPIAVRVHQSSRLINIKCYTSFLRSEGSEICGERKTWTFLTPSCKDAQKSFIRLMRICLGQMDLASLFIWQWTGCSWLRCYSY